jgi:hypothetical protein
MTPKNIAPRRSENRRGALPSKLAAACGTTATADDSLNLFRETLNPAGLCCSYLKCQGQRISRENTFYSSELVRGALGS